MKIAEAADRSGLSIDTIRFYERSGLLPPIARGADGMRRFSPETADWLRLLASLRETGMELRAMRRFAELYRQGDATIPERRRMLQEHAANLELRRAALDRCAALLAHKLQRYSEIEGG
ncbi:MerR family transcriptional regulator [Ruegeria pomeroyi]|uniref:MerR family transcriptional regulator n=1 Tax=Ruegeria pomeroyi TaxID=89184 RepID=UPI001F3EB360|nr:MerR family transcriptional regulator [Ruegeria pomeroyi]MCE8509622.1 MerR family transcriptional regulator [Ruegeria pomeroyi]